MIIDQNIILDLLIKIIRLMIRFVPRRLFAISPPPHVPLVESRDDGRRQRRPMSTTEADDHNDGLLVNGRDDS